MKQLRKSLKSFKELNKKEKQLEIIGMLKSCGDVIFSVFMNVYAYQIFEGWTGIIRGNLLNLTTVVMGFLIVARIRTKKRINLKYATILGTIFFVLGNICFFSQNPSLILISYVLHGFGTGFWHVAWNNYEFIFVREKERGVFHANNAALNAVAKILLGLVISGIFLGAAYFESNAYVILGMLAVFLAMGLVYLSFSIPNHYEEKAELGEMKHLITKQNLPARGYLSLLGISSIYNIIFVLGSFYILASEVNMGSYESAITAVSIIFTLYLGKHITTQNRVKLFFLCCLGLFAVFTLFAFTLSRWSFLVLTMAQITICKFFTLTERVNTLHVMDDINQRAKSCFSVVLAREIALYIFRVVGLGILLPCLGMAETDLLKYSFLGLGGGYLLVGSILQWYTKKAELPAQVEVALPLSCPAHEVLPAFVEVEAEVESLEKNRHIEKYEK